MGLRSYLFGKEGEQRAKEYLIKKGFVIVEENFHSQFGEIDIIAIKEGVLHFIEVKASKQYEPLYRITPKKMQKILKTVDYYLLQKRVTLPYQIDAIVIKKKDCEMIENISII